MQIDVYNIKNEKTGKIDLPESLFSAPWRPALVHQIILAMQANRRQPWAHVKGRSEVRGGGRKPWRQKGTGRSRHGSNRSPLWIGGGKAHGPTKDRDYSQKINRKARLAALASVLSRKVKDGEIKVLDAISLSKPKTKELAATLKVLTGTAPRVKNMDLVLVPEMGRPDVFRAGRNIPKTKIMSPASMNIEDILSHKHLFLAQEAVATITKTYARESRD